ncbi:MAG TPA: hypothetical protein VL651_15845 [Bacteroidia bacterium]|jgi:hypothetical protein|nr:hypothetical protein [Bacteroidia bacterium]
MKRRGSFYFWIIIFLQAIACTPEQKPVAEPVKEGIISYSCTAIDTSAMRKELTPHDVTLTFKGKHRLWSETLGNGFAFIRYFTDLQKNESHTALFFFEKRQCLFDSAEVIKEKHTLPDYSVVYGNDSMTIAGHTCHDATLVFPDGSPWIRVWYTREIVMDRPNWENEYYKIDGVLMDFVSEQFGANFRFTATSVTPKTVDDSCFEISPDYKMFDPHVLQTTLSGVFTK